MLNLRPRTRKLEGGPAGLVSMGLDGAKVQKKRDPGGPKVPRSSYTLGFPDIHNAPVKGQCEQQKFGTIRGWARNLFRSI